MRKLLDDNSDSESGDDAGGVPLGKQSSDTGFKVNEDYARRFEHNKKREEVARRTCLHSTFSHFACMLTLA